MLALLFSIFFGVAYFALEMAHRLIGVRLHSHEFPRSHESLNREGPLNWYHNYFEWEAIATSAQNPLFSL